ncbi:hypothetical protein H5410_042297 [Solanum commersonii]|uniref:Uncharacterized protein n=1 Tax=Solanum commersonii TaxID=4109 RepID=A0A9J5XVZ8_SOLCO|nr:hypothetical protein H5410_042297 [Solanum commersonii]
MAEVKNLLLERRKHISSPTTISDLKQEINNLKKDIHHLKEKNVTIEIRLDNVEKLVKRVGPVPSGPSLAGQRNSMG